MNGADTQTQNTAWKTASLCFTTVLYIISFHKNADLVCLIVGGYDFFFLVFVVVGGYKLSDPNKSKCALDQVVK